MKTTRIREIKVNNLGKVTKEKETIEKITIKVHGKEIPLPMLKTRDAYKALQQPHPQQITQRYATTTQRQTGANIQTDKCTDHKHKK